MLREAARRPANYWFYRTGLRSTSHVAWAAISFSLSSGRRSSSAIYDVALGPAHARYLFVKHDRLAIADQGSPTLQPVTIDGPRPCSQTNGLPASRLVVPGKPRCCQRSARPSRRHNRRGRRSAAQPYTRVAGAFAKASAQASSGPAKRGITVSFGSTTAKRAGRRTGAAVKRKRKLKPLLGSSVIFEPELRQIFCSCRAALRRQKAIHAETTPGLSSMGVGSHWSPCSIRSEPPVLGA
jgi:hypothetical protein